MTRTWVGRAVSVAAVAVNACGTTAGHRSVARPAPRLSATQLDDNVEAESEIGCRMFTRAEVAAATGMPVKGVHLPTGTGGDGCVYAPDAQEGGPFLSIGLWPGPVNWRVEQGSALTMTSPVKERVAGTLVTCYSSPETPGGRFLTAGADPNWTFQMYGTPTCAEQASLMTVVIDYARDEPPQRPPSDIASTAGSGAGFAMAAWLAASNWWGGAYQGYYPALAAWDLQRGLANEHDAETEDQTIAAEYALIELAGRPDANVTPQESAAANQETAVVDKYFRLPSSDL